MRTDCDCEKIREHVLGYLAMGIGCLQLLRHILYIVQFKWEAWGVLRASRASANIVSEGPVSISFHANVVYIPNLRSRMSGGSHRGGISGSRIS